MTPTEMMLRHFTFDHLPERLQLISAPFRRLALRVSDGSTAGPETTTALRKLLEAKDCAVRAVLHESIAAPDPPIIDCPRCKYPHPEDDNAPEGPTVALVDSACPVCGWQVGDGMNG